MILRCLDELAPLGVLLILLKLAPINDRGYMFRISARREQVGLFDGHIYSPSKISFRWDTGFPLMLST